MSFPRIACESSFLQFPPELQEKVLACIHNTQTMVTLLQVNREMENIVRPRLFQYFLEQGLYEIISNAPNAVPSIETSLKMSAWKKAVFDTFPHGHPTRTIIIHALFFLLGQYNRCSQHWTHLYPSVITEDFEHMWKIGWLFRPFAYDMADTAHVRGYVRKTKINIKRINALRDPLFEKIVQIPDIQHAIETRLEELTKHGIEIVSLPIWYGETI